MGFIPIDARMANNLRYLLATALEKNYATIEDKVNICRGKLEMIIAEFSEYHEKGIVKVETDPELSEIADMLVSALMALELSGHYHRDGIHKLAIGRIERTVVYLLDAYVDNYVPWKARA